VEAYGRGFVSRAQTSGRGCVMDIFCCAASGTRVLPVKSNLIYFGKAHKTWVELYAIRTISSYMAE